MDNQSYFIIDETLKDLLSYPYGNPLRFDIRADTTREAIHLMIENELIQYAPIKQGRRAFIKHKGRLVVEYGSFEKWISDKKIIIQENKESLEFKKLRYDVKNAERIFKTYKITFGMTVIALIISIVLLVLKLEEPTKQEPLKYKPILKVNHLK